jgi:hypothetical protein
MSWIDDGIEESRKRRERKKLIAENAEGIFNGLWKELLVCIGEAKTKGFQLETNGSPSTRVVNLSGRYLKIALDKEAEKITVRGSSVDVDFPIDVSPDNVTHLNYKSKSISLTEAAKEALRPLLFPELITTEHNGGEAGFFAPSSEE